MAQQGNNQLKIYNQFNAGEQNVPADHLINDKAFSKGVNFDLVDSTLRPVRTDKVLSTPTIPTNTEQYIQENVKGEDVDLFFDKPIDYVNYGDTVYYLDTVLEGSPLKQITTDGSLSSVEAFPIITGDLTIVGSSEDDIVLELQRYYDRLSSAYQDYVADVSTNVDQQNVTTQEYYGGSYHTVTTNALLDRYKTYTADSELQDDITNVTYETYPTVFNSIKERFKNCIDETSTMIAETEGTIKDRLAQVDAERAGFPSTYLGDTDSSNFPVIYGNTMGALILRNVNPETHVAANNRYHWLVKFANALILEVDKYLDYSMCSYMAVKTHSFKHEDTGAVFTEDYPSIKAWGERTKTTLQAIIDRKAQDGVDGWVSFPDYPTDEEKAYAKSITSYEDRASAIMFLHFCFTWSIKVVLWDTAASENPYYHDITPATVSSNFLQINAKTKDFREALEAVNVEQEVFEGLSSYAVVGYNDKINTYTNMIRSSDVLDNSGVTLSFSPEPSISKYLIYRRGANDTEYTLQTETTTFPVTINPEYSTDGLVPVVPYRIQEPHTDYVSIAEYRGAIFLNRKNSQEIYYTMPNNPHDMKATSYIDMPQDVKAMKSAGSGLFIWTTNNALYLLTGSPRNVQLQNTLNIKLVGENVDIINKRSVTSQDALVVWLSDYAIHNTSGYGSANATKYVWKPPEGLVPIQTIVYKKNIYFLCSTSTGNLLIEYDTSRKAVRTIDTEVKSLSVIGTNLVGVSENNAYHMFKGDTYKEYDVELKRFAGYTYDLRQRFTNITVFHTPKPYEDEVPLDMSNITKVYIYIDEALVVDGIVIQGLQATRIPIPSTNNVGYSIKVRLKGSLGIKSVKLRYTAINYED